MKRKMFVNIELMILIAIFGIIVAILIPHLSKALAKHGYSRLWAPLLMPGVILVFFGPMWCKDRISDWREKRRKKNDDGADE